MAIAGNAVQQLEARVAAGGGERLLILWPAYSVRIGESFSPLSSALRRVPFVTASFMNRVTKVKAR